LNRFSRSTNVRVRTIRRWRSVLKGRRLRPRRGLRGRVSFGSKCAFLEYLQTVLDTRAKKVKVEREDDDEDEE